MKPHSMVLAGLLVCTVLGFSPGRADADPKLRVDHSTDINLNDLFVFDASGYRPNTQLTISTRPADGSQNWIILDTTVFTNPVGSASFSRTSIDFVKLALEELA